MPFSPSSRRGSRSASSAFRSRDELNPRDVYALWRISRRIKALAPDVLHGHGAKGAALARLTPAAPNAIRAYTPHGGSLVYCPGTLSGGFYRSLERILNPLTDLFLFESSYIAELYRNVIAPPHAMVRVVRNGIAEAEFEPAVPRRRCHRYRLRGRTAAG